MGIDAYEDSVLLNKLKKRLNLHLPLRIAFLDIDSTMTGSQATTNSTRKKLELFGYVIVYVTARTEEMLMSSSQYSISKSHGFSRPVPLLGRNSNRRIYLEPEKVEPQGILDPDIIAGSTGTQILALQKSGGYLNDFIFEKNLGETSAEWRESLTSLIDLFNKPVKRAFFALYEDPNNYQSGIIDVYTPKFRIALSFQSAKEKLAFRTFIRQAQKLNSAYANIGITDDSLPRKEQYTLYLTPKNGTKTKAVDHIIKTICEKIAVERSDLHVLLAGDGHADFDMGMRAARGTCATFLLAGGSRLMPALTCKDEHLDILGEELAKLRISLTASKIKGHYSDQLYANRNIIICDEVNCDKKAVESIFPLIDDLERS